MKSIWRSIRSSLAIMVVGTVCYGFIVDKVSGETMIALAGTIIALYFTKNRKPAE